MQEEAEKEEKVEEEAAEEEKAEEAEEEGEVNTVTLAKCKKAECNYGLRRLSQGRRIKK